MADEKKSVTDTLSGQPGNLENLIAYQQDSVVSKTIIVKKTGTVTLFAFDKGQGLSLSGCPLRLPIGDARQQPDGQQSGDGDLSGDCKPKPLADKVPLEHQGQVAL